MKEDLIPVIILSIVTVYVFAHVLCLYYGSVRREARSRARERILRDRLSDAQDQAAVLQEANRRLSALLKLYERGRYQGDYQGEELDEILSAEYIGDN